MFVSRDTGGAIICAKSHKTATETEQIPDDDPGLLAFIGRFENLSAQAMQELNKITGPSGTIIRCVAAGIAVPAAWKTYVQALRAIANGTDTTSTTLPTRPAYPAGT